MAGSADGATGAMHNLYSNLLESWNKSDAEGFSSLFEAECLCVGFDGTEYTSASEIRTSLAAIFKDHQVASYVGIVRDVRKIDDHTFRLRAVAGMVPPGSHEIKPDRNTIQVLVASHRNGAWKIISYQNTPARYDGRPQASQELTQELQQALNQRK